MTERSADLVARARWHLKIGYTEPECLDAGDDDYIELTDGMRECPTCVELR